MTQDGTYTIRRVNILVRWTEFWWEEIPAPENPFDHEDFHFTAKTGALHQALMDSELQLRLDEDELRGVLVTIKDGFIEKVSSKSLQAVAYRVDYEGFDYAMNSWSSWEGVADPEFQGKLARYKEAREDLMVYIEAKDLKGRKISRC